MSAIFALSQSDQQLKDEDAARNGIPLENASVNAFSGSMREIGNAPMRFFAKAGETLGLASAAIDLGVDRLFGTHLADNAFRLVDEYTQPAIEYWTPDAHTTGAAAKVLGGLTETVTGLAVTGGKPSAALPTLAATQSLPTGVDLVRSGVSPGAATAVTMTEAAATGLGFELPFLGKTLTSKVASGIAGNLLLNRSSELVTHQILKQTGNEAASESFDPFTKEKVLTDIFTGALFGAYAHVTATPNVPRILPSHVDAALTESNAKHFQHDTAPGVPADIPSSVAHQDALKKALSDTLKGEPVNVESTGVREANFEPRSQPDVGVPHEAEKELNLPKEAPQPEQKNIAPESIKENIARQLIDAGMDEESARANAVLTQAFFDTMAKRTGQTAQDLFDRYNLRVTSEAQKGDVLAQNFRAESSSHIQASQDESQAIQKAVNTTRLEHGLEAKHISGDGSYWTLEHPDTGERATVRVLKDHPSPKEGGFSLAFMDRHGPPDIEIRKDSNDQFHIDVNKGFLKEYPEFTDFTKSLRKSITDSLSSIANKSEATRSTLSHGQTEQNTGAATDQNGRTTVAGTKPAEGWEAATRIRGKSGQPLELYRGAARALSEQDFRDESLGQATGHPSAGLGIFFTTDQTEASRYGNVESAFLDLRKPKLVKIEDVPAFDEVKDAIAWREQQKEKGFDGLVVQSSHLGGPNWVVAFDPKQVIKEQQTFFQSGEKNLVVAHNTTEEKIGHIVRMGGMAVPSLAVTKAGAPIEGFGDITLVGSPEMVNPKGYAKARVFGADIYSPRYPKVEFKLDKFSLKRINRELEPFRKEGQRDIYSGEIGDVEDLLSRDDFKEYTKSKNDGEFPGYHKSREMAAELLRESGADERIFRGFTNSGNRSYTPHTLENVVRILKKELRAGEGFNYGVGSLRAKYTPQFKSLQGIKNARELLVSKAEFEKVKEEVDKEFFSLVGELEDHHPVSDRFGFADTVIGTLQDAANMGLDRAFRENGFKEIPAEIKQKVAEFLTKLRNLPTEYFEAKILRDVSLAEFSGAVVPKGTSQKTIDALRKHGLDISEYEKDVPGDRARAINELAASKDLLFQENRGSFSPTQNIISLFKDADRSTFLHESGHFYLDVLGDLAERENAPDGIKEDWNTVLNWLGVKSKAEIGVAQHEQWARGFEQYLMEGKAPSPELKSIFDRFKDWLLNIYKQAKNLNVELSDDVRKVMDRLLAQNEKEAASKSPEVRAAEDALAGSDIKIPTGEIDADGNAVTVSARELLARAREDVAKATNDAKAFSAAVTCFLANAA